jgi:oxygen-dependent protoporphyrinogen oxidase
MERVAVVGGGPAGCYAAYQLKRRGCHVVLFEAADAVGGRTRSYRYQGLTLDTGAAFITNFYALTHRLIKQLGLSQTVASVNRSTALSRGGDIAQLTLGSAKSFVKYPFITAAEKAKMAFHMSKLVACRFQHHLTDVKKLAKYDDRSIAEYARGELTENVYQCVVRPGVEPFWYFSCETVSRALYMALGAHAPDARFFVFTQGIDALCAALVKRLDVQLRQRVVAVQSHEDGFRVNLAGEMSQSDVFDRVIIATTASIAHSITAQLDETWVTSGQRRYLRSQGYAPNTHCVYTTPQFSRGFQGLSLFPCGAGDHPVAAVSFNSDKCAALRQAKRELISVYLGAAFSEAIQSRFQLTGQAEDGLSTRMLTHEDFVNPAPSVSEQMATAYEQSRELCGVLPVLAEVSPFFCVHRKEAIPIHAVGRYRQALDFQQRQQRQLSQQAGSTGVVGRGISFVGDYLSTASLEGALASVDALF